MAWSVCAFILYARNLPTRKSSLHDTTKLSHSHRGSVLACLGRKKARPKRCEYFHDKLQQTRAAPDHRASFRRSCSSTNSRTLVMRYIRSSSIMILAGEMLLSCRVVAKVLCCLHEVVFVTFCQILWTLSYSTKSFQTFLFTTLCAFALRSPCTVHMRCVRHDPSDCA